MKNSVYITEKTLPPLFVLILSSLGIVIISLSFFQGIFSLNEFKNSLSALIFALFISIIFFSDSVKENKAQIKENKKEKKNQPRISLDKILGLAVISLAMLAIIFIFIESVLQFLFGASLVGL